jgi:RNA polymerase sigma factor (TIGR02999 family)
MRHVPGATPTVTAASRTPEGQTAPGDITRLLVAARRGDRGALDRVVSLVYDELRRLAHRRLAREGSDHTLETGALVNEAYLKLAGLERIQWRDRLHFFGIAGGIMRRVLVDYAVRRRAGKRGGGWQRMELDRLQIAVGGRDEDLIALDEALERLAALDQRQARVVECRFFAGLSVADTAAALGISTATVKRDWTTARAWLHRDMAT